MHMGFRRPTNLIEIPWQFISNEFIRICLEEKGFCQCWTAGSATWQKKPPLGLRIVNLDHEIMEIGLIC
jgi:hypothetical protein